LFAGIMPANSL